MQVLQQGDEGFTVGLWQGFLIRQGLLVIDAPNGSFGPKTDQATRAFQSAHGLGVDGVVGPHTVAAAQAQHFVAPLDVDAMVTTILGPISKQRLTHVHPTLAHRIIEVVNTVAQRTPPIISMVDSGYRSFVEQDALFAQGLADPHKVVTKAKGGQSYHNYGLAVDLTSIINGKEVWNVADAKVRGAAGKAVALEWGGDWSSFPDLPHLQITEGLGVNDCLSRYQQLGIQGVWQEVSARLNSGVLDSGASGDEVE